MSNYYRSYIRAFIKFAQTTLEKQTILKTLTAYAISISEKAHELVQRAARNTLIDLPKLRTEVYQLGILYIHKFNDQIRNNFRRK